MVGLSRLLFAARINKRKQEKPMTWLDWYNSLAQPRWTPASATIDLIWQILFQITAMNWRK